MKLKTNDLVKVVAGKDKGKQGKVTRVHPQKNRVIVEGANKFKRHLKKQGDQPGGIVEVERALPVSNVMLICQSCKETTRVGYKVTNTGKSRICKKCQAVLDGAK
jgi:large subunit ribosomal protein L24